MADIRKPDFVFLLRNSGKNKSNKVELFCSTKWPKQPNISDRKYRIRVNGKWFPKNGEIDFYYKGQVRDFIFRSIYF